MAQQTSGKVNCIRNLFTSCIHPKSKRHVIAILSFLGFFCVYMLRVNLSIAIVSMTSNSTEPSFQNETKPFDWSLPTQGWILSSFFYGYIVSQLPAGWIAQWLGGVRLFGSSVLITSFLTLLTPIAATAGPGLVIFLRVVEGVFQGVSYPCILAVWSQWATNAEYSKLVTISFSGSYVGTVVTLPLSGLLAKNVGWQSIFYVTGSIGVLWSIIWMYYVKESPLLDETISFKELQLLKDSVQPQKSDLKIPWRILLRDLSVWAIVVAHFTQNWAFYTLLTDLPQYLKGVWGFEIDKVGFQGALPYLIMAIVLQLSGRLSDYLRVKGFLTTGLIRKIFTCGGFVLQIILTIVTAHSNQLAVNYTCVTLAVGCGGLVWAGFGVNGLDIAPRYASVIMGLSNTFGTLPGMVGPVLTGYLVQHETPEEWLVVFYIFVGIYVFGAIFYAVFAQGEKKPWSN